MRNFIQYFAVSFVYTLPFTICLIVMPLVMSTVFAGAYWVIDGRWNYINTYDDTFSRIVTLWFIGTVVFSVFLSVHQMIQDLGGEK